MTSPQAADRKRTGAWYTPMPLVERVIHHALDGWAVRPAVVRVLDPACGDGRFLHAAAEAIEASGGVAHLTGVDVDGEALAAAARRLAGGPSDRRVDLCADDALIRDWGGARFDLVVGNPPFLSQMAAGTTRGRASRWGGGPYADAAVEFLSLALALAADGGGRLALVLPQSILSSRDAGPVRAEVERRAHRCWSWWSPQRQFDASVVVCALVFETVATETDRRNGSWADVVTSALGVPPLPVLHTMSTLGDRASLNANFRDEYYGLVPAVVEGGNGPPLVTSGLIDPGRSLWGCRPARFAGRPFAEPRVALDRLSPAMQRWAQRKLVPKVLVASQTKVLEALADPAGELLPGVPVTAITPTSAGAAGGTDAGSEPAVWEFAATLTSPVATAWAWHRCAGSGLSAASLRTGPAVLADLPWPAGELSGAVAALTAGDIDGCGQLVDHAFGVDDQALVEWWSALRPRSGARDGTLTTVAR